MNAELATALCNATSVYWWQPIGCSAYFVGDQGEVYSTKVRRMLRGSASGIGYLAVQLKGDDGQIHRRYIHHLVAEAILKPQDHQCVRHLDGNLKNNAFTNLAYGTHRENMRDMKSHGRTAVGEKNPNAVLTKELVLEIRQKHRAGKSQHALATEYGVALMTINRAVRGISWSHI